MRGGQVGGHTTDATRRTGANDKNDEQSDNERGDRGGEWSWGYRFTKQRPCKTMSTKKNKGGNTLSILAKANGCHKGTNEDGVEIRAI
jgi:hypothetical protein